MRTLYNIYDYFTLISTQGHQHQLSEHQHNNKLITYSSGPSIVVMTVQMYCYCALPPDERSAIDLGPGSACDSFRRH